MQKRPHLTPLLGSLGCALLVSACSKSMSCSSDEAKALIADIEKRNTSIVDDFGKIEGDVTLSYIRTEYEDTKLNKLDCAASMSIDAYITLYKYYDDKSGNKLGMTVVIAKDILGSFSDIPLNKKMHLKHIEKSIDYKLELTSDGKLFATLYGRGGF
jgi:hypothetical protein